MAVKKSSIWAKIFLSLSVIYSILTFMLLGNHGIYDQKGGVFAILGGFILLVGVFFVITFLFSREISKVFRLAISVLIAALLIGVINVEGIKKSQRQRSYFSNMAELQRKTQSLWISISVSTAGCDDKILTANKATYSSCILELKKIAAKQLTADAQLESLFQEVLSIADNDHDIREFLSGIRDARSEVLLKLRVYTNSMISLFQFLDENEKKMSVKNDQIFFTTDEAVGQYNKLFSELEIHEDAYNAEIKAYSEKFSERLKKMMQAIENSKK